MAFRWRHWRLRSTSSGGGSVSASGSDGGSAVNGVPSASGSGGGTGSASGSGDSGSPMGVCSSRWGHGAAVATPHGVLALCICVCFPTLRKRH